MICLKDPSFACTFCKFRNKLKTKLKQHLINVHGIDPSNLATYGAGNKNLQTNIS